MKVLHAIAFALATAAVATPATSAIVTATYQGFVVGQNAYVGDFNLGTFVTDQTTFEAVFTIDTEKGELSPFAYDFQKILIKAADNPVSAVFKINSQTLALDTVGSVLLQDNDTLGNDEVSHFSRNTLSNVDFNLKLGFASPDDFISSLDFNTPVTLTDFGGKATTSYLERWDRNLDNDETIAVLDLRPTSLTIVSSQSPVPEPATWAFMIVGFGAIGASLRAARRSSGSVAIA